MDAAAFESTLATFRQRVPYRPFTIALMNGHRFEVDHPGAMVVRDGVAIFIGPGGVPVVFDHEGVVAFHGELMNQSTDL